MSNSKITGNTVLLILGLIFCVFVSFMQYNSASLGTSIAVFFILYLCVLMFFIANNLKSKLTFKANAIVWIVTLIFSLIFFLYAKGYADNDKVVCIAAGITLLVISVVGFALTNSASKEVAENARHLENVIGAVFLLPAFGYLASTITLAFSGTAASNLLINFVLPFVVYSLVAITAFFFPNKLPVAVLVMVLYKIYAAVNLYFSGSAFDSVPHILAIIFLLLSCFDVFNKCWEFSLCACLCELTPILITPFVLVMDVPGYILSNYYFAYIIYYLCYSLGFYFIGLTIKLKK